MVRSKNFGEAMFSKTKSLKFLDFISDRVESLKPSKSY